MEAARAIFLGLFTVVTAAYDLRTGRLPNWLTVPAFAAGLLFWTGGGLWQAGLAGAAGGLLFALGGFAVGFGILFVLWLLGGGLGGDVKFMGAIGAWLGAWLVFQALVASALFAGVCSVIMLVVELFKPDLFRPKMASGKGRRRKSTRGESPTQLTWLRRRGAVPYGVPATLGTWSILALHWTGHAIAWPPSP